MTPKEKAVEIHDKYYQIFEMLGFDCIPNNYAKEHAIICVKSILDAITTIADKKFDFYTEVMKEINDL